MARSSAARTTETRAREARLGFRVDAKTKLLVERAARIERRNVTDFCLTALIDAAHQAIDKEEALRLSAADRSAFFDAVVRPPSPNATLRRALRRERARVQR
jgi:uncharacterized protein (DUF1778 family)